MKKLLKFSLVLLAIVTATPSFSVGHYFQLSVDSSNITQLTFNDVKEGSLVLIKDSNEFILYREIIKKTGAYKKGFELTNLPDADYTIEIDNHEDIKVIPFTIKRGNTEVLVEDEYTIAKPEVIVKDNFVYVSKELGEKQSLGIDIFYEGDLAYSENFKETNSMSRVFDFNTSKKGEYLIIVESEGRKFKDNIFIK